MDALGRSVAGFSISFLGIQEEASRFVIIMDTSASVLNSVTAAGASMEEIREEAKKLTTAECQHPLWLHSALTEL